jgi:hypothetical protein
VAVQLITLSKSQHPRHTVTPTIGPACRKASSVASAWHQLGGYVSEPVMSKFPNDRLVSTKQLDQAFVGSEGASGWLAIFFR